MCRDIFLSGTYRYTDEVEAYLAPVTAAGNCKKPEAIAKSIEERTEARAQIILDEPLFNRVDRLALYDGIVVSSSTVTVSEFNLLSDPQTLDVEQCAALLDRLKTASVRGPVRFYGTGIHRLLRTLFLQLAEADCQLERGLWDVIDDAVDPVEKVLGKYCYNGLTPEALCRRVFQESEYVIPGAGQHIWDYFDPVTGDVNPVWNVLRDIVLSTKFGLLQ